MFIFEISSLEIFKHSVEVIHELLLLILLLFSKGACY